MTLEVRPVTLKQANAFVDAHHRHNKPARGHKFSIGVFAAETLVGVAIAGRPVARGLDDGRTLEVNRTCTDGYPNANSMLYGAIWRAAKAMGYLRCVTYTREDEPGTSLRAAGWVRELDLPARRSWGEHTRDERLKQMRAPIGDGGVARVRWSISR